MEKTPKKLERLTFDELVKTITEKFGGGEGVHLDVRNGVYYVAYEDSPNNELWDGTGTTLFSAGRVLYKKIFGNPVVEVPNGYSQGMTERVVERLCTFENNYVTVNPNKIGFTATMFVQSNKQWAIGRGLTVHHALVFMHRNMRDMGVDIRGI